MERWLELIRIVEKRKGPGAGTKEEQEQHVGGGDQASVNDGQPEEEIHSDGRTNNFGEVACSYGGFARYPQQLVHPRIKFRTADLCKVLPGYHSKSHCKPLEKHGHQAGYKHYKKKFVVIS